MPPKAEPVVPPFSYRDYFADRQVHRRLLADHHRLRLFRNALSEEVRPGLTVMDLGAGTGVLTRMALSLGAARVVAVEQNPGIFLWNDKLRAAHANGRLVVIEENSISWDGAGFLSLVDIVVSETIGTFGINEGILPALEDAQFRLLKPGGTIIPTSVGLDFFLRKRVAEELTLPRVVFESFCGNLEAKASLTFTTGTSNSAAGSATISVPPGRWELVVLPNARLTEAVSFGPPNEPTSFGMAILPLPMLSAESELWILMSSSQWEARAYIEVGCDPIYTRSFTWQF